MVTRLQNYACPSGVYDELIDASGEVRPHWAPLLAAIEALPPKALEQAFSLADQHLRQSGVSFRHYGAQSGAERDWPLAHMPLVINSAEWKTLSDGLVQRADLLERVLDDLYGPGDLVKYGLLPAQAVAGSAEFLRPLVGVDVRARARLGFYAADVARMPDGSWRVLADRTQAPAGAGYALENRIALSGAAPDLFRTLRVSRLAGFFHGFRTELSSLADAEGQAVLLSPGPLNETYFEHAYLARYLGLGLVEGEDLTVRDDRVYMRTVFGLRRVDVIWRRLDSDWADPIELNNVSQLGVPGLVGAVRAGSVTVLNALGAGVAESPVLQTFLPRLSRHLLGQELQIPGLKTLWCADPADRAKALEDLNAYSFAPAFLPSTVPSLRGSRRGADLTMTERADLIALVQRSGRDVVAQEPVRLGTTPVWTGAGFAPRPFALRLFLAKAGGRWTVMPGGFCQVSDTPQARGVTIQNNGRSADVWVISDGPVSDITLLRSADHVRVRRDSGDLSSRAAENLFWAGRYVERTEATLRLLKTLRNFNAADPAEPQWRVLELLRSWKAAPDEDPKLTLFDVLRASLGDPELSGGLPTLTQWAKSSVSVIRDRFSPEAWSAINDAARLFSGDVDAPGTEAAVHERIDQALRVLAALSGVVNENMVRSAAWRFLEIGRRVERAILTSRAIRTLALAEVRGGALNQLLQIADSQITYRRRYFIAPERTPVLDLIVSDPLNPRAIRFQIKCICDDLSALAAHQGDDLAGEILSLAELGERLERAAPDTMNKAFFLDIETEMMRASDQIHASFFTHPGAR